MGVRKLRVGASRRVGTILCLGGAAIGALGLLADLAGVRVLAKITPGLTLSAAVSLMLTGCAGALRAREDAGRARKALAAVAALLAFAIAFATVAEYVLKIDLHLDRLLPAAANGARHGRPSGPTALAIACLSAGALIFDIRGAARVRPCEWLIIAAGLIAVTALLGFAFDAELKYPSPRAPLIGTALPAALALLLIAVGMLLERPHAGVMRVVSSTGPGGRQFRRFVLPALLVPTALGLTVIFPLRAVDEEALSAVVAVLASAMIVVGLLVLATTAASLNRSYEALEASRAHTSALVDQAPDGVFITDLDGRYTDVNGAACRMLGYDRAEILGKTIVDLIPAADVDRLSQTRNLLLEGGTEKGEWTLRRKDGSYLPVEVSAKIMPDGRWQALVRDISERKRLEGELRTAEAEQKFLADLG